MSADITEVRQLLKALTHHIHRLDEQDITNGDNNSNNNSNNNESVFTIPQIQLCLSNIRHFERYRYKEVEDFISALQSQISKLQYGYEQYF